MTIEATKIGQEKTLLSGERFGRPAMTATHQLAENESIGRAAVTVTCAGVLHYKNDRKPFVYGKLVKVLVIDGKIFDVEKDLRRHELGLHAKTGCPDVPQISINVIVF